MQNLLCKLLGHKWRDTSYWEFKREKGKKLKRKIARTNCNRCDKVYPPTIEEATGAWISDE